jgi:hypothetical protein
MAIIRKNSHIRSLILVPLFLLLLDSRVRSDETYLRPKEKCVQPPPAHEVYNGLDHLIDTLRKKRHGTNPVSLPPFVALPPPANQKELDEVERSLRDLEDRDAKRTDAIHTKLQQLKNALKEKERRQMEALIRNMPKPEAKKPDVKIKQPINRDVPKETTKPNPKQIPPPQSTTPPKNTSNDRAINPAPTLVTSSTINRLKLADSLFGAGDTQLALKIYSDFDVSKLPRSDRTWVKFQTASCNRRLGAIAEAETLFRSVAGEKNGGVYAETARWWLDRINSRKKLESTLQQINQSIKTLETVNASN